MGTSEQGGRVTVARARVRALLKEFEAAPPEVVLEWHDPETSARGWAVINSLRGGAAGGGTRMRAGLDRNEVESLAKTMEVKFTVSGPAIGGAKSGIDFDPTDPRRDEVLARWFRTVTPLLKAYYGTGGDLNVDEVHDVIPLTERNGLWHPQQGVVTGHFRPDEHQLVQRVGMLRLGVSKVVEDPRYAPPVERRFTIADLVTGWGVAESVLATYATHFGGEPVAGKRALVQGWGNVGAAAAHYLARAGVQVVGVIDRDGGLLPQAGLGPGEVDALLAARGPRGLVSAEALPFDEVDARFWDVEADIFLPCAASRLVTSEQVERLVRAGVEVIACGANVPFADAEIFYGPTYELADTRVAVVPDFIANCGMARAFTRLMDGTGVVTDEVILEDVSRTIRAALRACSERSPARTGIAATALKIALEQLTGGGEGVEEVGDVR